MMAVVNNSLGTIKIEWSEEACACVVMASAGYPGHYETGFPITGMDAVDKDMMVFHAGTKRRDDGAVVTAGGRVLAVSALGETVAAARARAYEAADCIRWPGRQRRSDIAAGV
jgi:phosphoribosylamine--glycine ligase